MGIRTSLRFHCAGQIKEESTGRRKRDEKREKEGGRGHEWTESSAGQYLAAWTDKKGHNAEGRIDSPRSRGSRTGGRGGGYAARRAAGHIVAETMLTDQLRETTSHRSPKKRN